LIDMQPVSLFPWIALAFACASLWSWRRQRSFSGAARTWGLMALIFALVWAWLLAQR
jgi:hypothetical protein